MKSNKNIWEKEKHFVKRSCTFKTSIGCEDQTFPFSENWPANNDVNAKVTVNPNDAKNAYCSLLKFKSILDI